MPLFDFDQAEKIGVVQSVDTGTVVVRVTETEQLSMLQVNHMVAIRASMAGQTLIGMVSKIMRKYGDEADLAEGEDIATADIVKIILVGTLLDMDGRVPNVFKRTLESVPSIDAECYRMADEMLTAFMSVISGNIAQAENPLCIGSYALETHAKAFLDGNKLFQRHAVIVGSTGSGKSYTVAKLLEQIEPLHSCNAVVFDIHGEYTPLEGDHIHHYKIAGPTDVEGEHTLYLPYWLLTYSEMLSLMLDRSDDNAPNQAMLFSQAVLKAKRTYLEGQGNEELLGSFTIDSPIPYRVSEIIRILDEENLKMVPGSAGKEKQGPYFGKLTRFIQRLNAKIQDRRLNFMFSDSESLFEYSYMKTLCQKLMAPASQGGGVKILDFSEVPSDILPLIVSLVARLIFSVQQWVKKEELQPIALFCDEAHLYVPANAREGVENSSLHSFERIAKEGRKYGVGLVVITQRPSEVNHTVLSQSSNFIAMRLTNIDDQNVVKRLLPDSLGNFSELLPVLDIGEAIIVGDASLLPSRIKVEEPNNKPDSATVKFWDEWSKEDVPDVIEEAVESLRRQSR